MKEVLKVFQESLKVSQGLFKRFSKKFQGCSKENERVSLGSFKGLSREFKGNVSSFKITRLFYKASNGSFKSVLGKI